MKPLALNAEQAQRLARKQELDRVMAPAIQYLERKIQRVFEQQGPKAGWQCARETSLALQEVAHEYLNGNHEA